MEHAPDFYGPPLRAWRTWFVVPRDGKDGPLRLKSFVYTNLWEIGEPKKATCRTAWARMGAETHKRAPVESCGCGIYGLKEREAVDKYYRSKDSWCSTILWHEIWRVRGEVALWGKIVPGELGYRAEYAYPTKLEVPKQIKGREQFLSPKEIAIALEHYSCEVEVTEDVIDLR